MSHPATLVPAGFAGRGLRYPDPVLFFIGAAVAVVAIAGYALWWVTTRLATTEAAAVYDIAEATEYVADRLPDALQAKLSHSDVEVLLYWHLTYLRGQGMATFGETDLEAQEAAVGGETVIAAEEAVVDAVMADARESGRDIDEVDVVVVIELSNAYLRDIGAFGPSTELA